MSLNKIIIGFIIILLLFCGAVWYEINKAPIPKSKLIIDNHTFSVEIATTSAQQQLGLSGRTSLPTNQGMLFIFPKPQQTAFWMKGMKFPLDIIFFNNNKIVDMYQNVPVPTNGDNNLPIYTPHALANQALEINGGLAKSYGFKKGDTVKENLSK